ncbi:DHH family phosphoesterase [Marinicrinis lubricantis]|uniref:Bifunctional oligoribonuclease/PAP phosphatase NrnA n=1 Tax=Marinicrinis lubricantis TaxID=2086470 RepID=A0ABW1IMA9_9BACL
MKTAYQDQLHEAKRFMESYNHFLVVSHIHPDGDAASSTCAIGLILDFLGKPYTLMNEGAVPGKLSYLKGFDQIVNYTLSDRNYSFDAVISVDCADFERMGETVKLFPKDIPLLNIDHHPTNDQFGTVNLVEPQAAATAEILFDLVEYIQIPWSKELSDCIYTGLLTDTGGFRYSNTSSKVMKAASQLLDYGTDGYELSDRLLEQTTRAHVELLKKSLNSLSFAHDDQIAWVTVGKEDMRETGAMQEDLEGIVNYPRNIAGVEVGMLFKEMMDGTVKCSFRSAGKADVARIAQKFGGGGHVRAAGATLKAPLTQAIEMVVEEVKRALDA